MRRAKLVSLVLMALVMVFVCGCSAEEPVNGTGGSHTLRGTVTITGMSDAGGCEVSVERQIAGTRSASVYGKTSGVTLSRSVTDNAVFTTTTASSGAFSVSGLPDGLYIVTVRKADTLGAVVKDVAVGNVSLSRAVVDLDIVLTATGRMSGRVTLDGVSGDLYGSFVYAEGTSYIAATDAAGNFVLKDIPVGTYNIVFYHEGFFSTLKTNVTILAAVDNPVGTVNLAKISDNVYLSALTTSEGSLAPAFSQYICLYTLMVNQALTSITVTPSAQDTASTLRVNGEVVATGVASSAILLNSTHNVICIDVISAKGSVRTYTIQSSKDTCVVSFDKNAGDATGSMSGQVFVCGSSAPLSANEFSRIGYHCVGWSETSGGANTYPTGTMYTSGAGDVTLYAVWELNSYEVVIDPQNGEPTTSSWVSHGSIIAEPTTPVNGQYTFSGWYTDAACTITWDFNTPILSGMTLYAKWLRYYTVSFNPAGGSGGIVTQSVLAGEKVIEPSNPTRDGYIFRCWNKESYGYYPWDFNTDIVTKDTMLWAKWYDNRLWSAITSSSDGMKLAAVVWGGQIYTSTDGGATWTARESNRYWSSIVSSSDGTKLAAVVRNGQIYTSSDSGATWTARETDRNWITITSSSDGAKLAAVVYGGQVYTSTDSGETWVARFISQNWHGITSSSDGTKLAATVKSGNIWTSADSGVSWTLRGVAHEWGSITCSDNGAKLAVLATGYQIYTSSDSGASWIPRDSNRVWYSIASSSDGMKLAAVVKEGYIYTSTDSGVTWVARGVSRNWYSITSSSDGTKLAAVVYNGQVFTSEDSGLTWNVRF